MNSIYVIKPYKYYGQWVFDDESTGLIREAFVSGTDDIIDVLVENISGAEEGFLLSFSDIKFPDYQVMFEWVESVEIGNWYQVKKLNMFGWLCPALFKYFDTAPKIIYVKTKQIN